MFPTSLKKFHMIPVDSFCKRDGKLLSYSDPGRDQKGPKNMASFGGHFLHISKSSSSELKHKFHVHPVKTFEFCHQPIDSHDRKNI